MSSLAEVQRLMVKELELTAEQVVPQARLEDLGVDSLATIEFIFVLEEHFKVEALSETAQIETVADIAREVDLKLLERAAAPPAAQPPA